MFAHLPEPIQQKILNHLAADNFPAAKAVRDQFVQDVSYPFLLDKISRQAPAPIFIWAMLNKLNIRKGSQ